jgi:CheY-like chemotaxis protein
LPGRRLLVIDNELSILQSMAALLGQWGCEVLTATDEAGAFDVLQDRAPELILADFHLDHGVVGCEVVKHLREHFQQTIPAVIITADRSDQCRRALRKLNAPLLNKPVKPGKLRAVLSQWERACSRSRWISWTYLADPPLSRAGSLPQGSAHRRRMLCYPLSFARNSHS